MISTRNLTALPDIDTLRRRMQSLAMLDAILSPEWEYRYFSFDCRWGKREQMGSMRSGHGDHYFALFSAAGCWIKGFDPESPMAEFPGDSPKIRREVLGDVPKAFAACLIEPAFLIEETTFCIWRRTADSSWQHGNLTFPGNNEDPDGSTRLLPCLDGNPQTYRAWASDYYEQEVSIAAVQSIYDHRPLDQNILRQLNNELSMRELKADLKDIGYPAE